MININLRQKILELARSFPTLRDAPIESKDYPGELDPEKLDQWNCGPEPGSGATAAARFILSVFNDSVEWKSGKFDLHQSLGCWDSYHRAAFARWVSEPWWP